MTTIYEDEDNNKEDNNKEIQKTITNKETRGLCECVLADTLYNTVAQHYEDEDNKETWNISWSV